ncbi:hypothetical protein ACFLQL_03415 [Verrucomicrobiota bacterium]
MAQKVGPGRRVKEEPTMYNEQIIDPIINMLNRVKQSLFQIFPNLIAAVCVLLVGILIAHLVRAFWDRLINNLERFIPNKKAQDILKRFIVERPVSKVISGILYWMIIFFSFTVATETLGLPVITTWLSGMAEYLPRILVACLIGFAGIIAGHVVRDIVVTAITSARLEYGDILGKLAQAAIVLVTMLIGIRQLGIDITFLTNIITGIVVALLFGAVLAFGLGAKTSVSNILASHYLKKTHIVGNAVKIEDVKGRIIEITPVSVILDTTEGQVFIPAKKFSESASLLIKEE